MAPLVKLPQGPQSCLLQMVGVRIGRSSLSLLLTPTFSGRDTNSTFRTSWRFSLHTAVFVKDRTAASYNPIEFGLSAPGWKIPGYFRVGDWGGWDLGKGRTSVGYNAIESTFQSCHFLQRTDPCHLGNFQDPPIHLQPIFWDLMSLV